MEKEEFYQYFMDNYIVSTTLKNYIRDPRYYFSDKDIAVIISHGANSTWGGQCCLLPGHSGRQNKSSGYNRFCNGIPHSPCQSGPRPFYRTRQNL